MKQPIILITSCERDRKLGGHDAIRETWAAGAFGKIEIRFLLGRGGQATCLDEWALDVPDDMGGVTAKTREGHRWARVGGYGYIFQCFSDTYVVLDRLLASGFEAHDYLGYFPHCPAGAVPEGVYAFGGPGYWLSPRATEALLASPWPAPPLRGGAAEDRWVGRILRAAGIGGWHDPRYQLRGAIGPRTVSLHVGRDRGHYDPAWIREAHALHTSAK